MKILRKAAQVINSLWSPEWYQRNGFYRLAALLGGEATSAGECMTVEKAMRCSAAYICTRVITEPLAGMPLPVMRKVGFNRVFESDSLVHKLLNVAPNGYQTAKTFRRVLTHHALNYGNGYARIDRRPNGEPYALHILHPTALIKKEISGNDLRYEFRTADGGTATYLGSQIFCLTNYSDDGINGIGAVSSGKEAIAQALAIEAFGATFFGRGGLKAGLLKKVIPFKFAEDRQKFEDDFKSKYRDGREGFHKNLLVEGDWDYKPIGADPTEAQLVEARAAMVPEIARFYGVTPHLAGDLSRAHFANVEHLWIEYINITLMPWMIAWEQEIHRVLLTDAQKATGWYAKHNAAAFQRGDFEARMRGYATLLQNGVASINECRALEDWDPVQGGEAHHIQLNMQTVPGTGEPTASERAAMAKTEPKPVEKAEPVTVNIAVPEKKASRRIIRDDAGRIAGIEETE
jgi:HK97 family phage portal protein